MRSPNPLRREDRPSLGIALMCLAIFLWVVHDAISKWLADGYSLFEIIFVRSAVSLVPLVFLLNREGGYRRLRTRNAMWLLARGTLGLCSFGLFLSALPLMSLANVFAVVMAGPLLVTALSVVLLKEHVGVRRWVAVLVGFTGILLIARPGGEIPLVGLLYLLGSVTCYALTMLSTRWLGTHESASVMSVYNSVVAVCVCGIATLTVWTTPSAGDLLLMALIGLIAGIAQYTMTEAFRIAPPSVVAPYEYTALVWAMAIGYLVWGDIPTSHMLIGSGIVVLCGLYVLHRERIVAKANLRTPSNV